MENQWPLADGPNLHADGMRKRGGLAMGWTSMPQNGHACPARACIPVIPESQYPVAGRDRLTAHLAFAVGAFLQFLCPTMTDTLALLLMAAIVGTATPATAQTMYRCNNTYQDRPCSGGQEGKVVARGATPDASLALPASPKVSAVCSQRGAAAQKIKWAREAGQTQQQQEAASTDGLARDLIADVYRRPGTSGQVRSAIEVDCMAEQERATRAAALIEAANVLQGGKPATTARGDTGHAQGSSTAGANASNAALSDTVRSSNAAGKQLECQRLTEQLNDVRARQRSGASAGGMEMLRQQYQDTTQRLRTAGC